MGPAKVLFVLPDSGFIFSLVTHPKSAILIWMRRMEGSSFAGKFSPKKWHQIYGDLNLISNKGCKYRLTWKSSHGSNKEKKGYPGHIWTECYCWWLLRKSAVTSLFHLNRSKTHTGISTILKRHPPYQTPVEPHPPTINHAPLEERHFSEIFGNFNRS